MRILVACALPEFALDELRLLGSEVAHEPNLDAAALAESIADVGVLVVNKLPVSAETIAQADALQMIVHTSSGAGNITLEAASAEGIFVTHCPDQEATAIAELTMGLVLALDRSIVDNTLALRAGRWDRSETVAARGLAGRTLGILDCGPVGCAVAHLARAFGMNVAGWGATLTPELAAEHEIRFCNWPRELARSCDVVAVHNPPQEERQLLVDAEFLESMRTGAHLVHVGHPSTVDELALARAIEERQLRVALDVYASEPSADVSRIRSRLLGLPGVIGTPHIGAHTEQARHAVATEVVRIIRAFLVSGEVLNCIDLIDKSPARWQLVLRVRDQVGVMAAVLDAVRADGINAEEITSRVFIGAKAAWCTIALDERPSTEALEAVRALDDVLHLDLRAVV
ncbi:MAG: hypothetical protein KKB50_13880 [Planctomycetes bacterium]|nr:hypothetical protein [Planctomycetota bacterium]